MKPIDERLDQQFLDHLAADVREPKITTLESESQLGMIETQQMKNRSLHVVDMNLVLGSMEPELVGGSERLTRFDTRSGKPHGKGIDMMIPAESLSLLSHRRSPELSSPDHQCLVQQSSLLKILDQGGTRPVDLLADLI